MDLGAPQNLGKAFDHVRQAERGHEQGDRRTIDQGAQHQPLDRNAPAAPCRQGGDKGPAERHAAFQQADKRQRRKQHHGALGEIEDAGRLVDQHKADGHQGIHDAGQQPADQHFEEKFHARGSSVRVRRVPR